jgi:hypothetical protein
VRAVRTAVTTGVGAWLAITGVASAEAPSSAAQAAAPSSVNAPALEDPTQEAPPHEAATQEHPTGLAAARTGTQLGLGGTAALGLTVGYGGSLWLEHALSPRRTGLLRVTYLRGHALEGDGDSFDAVTAQLGHRWFWGAFFAGLELGAIAARERTYVDYVDDRVVEGDWDIYPSASAGIGAKLHRLELGLTAHFPLLTIGAHLGLDVAWW